MTTLNEIYYIEWFEKIDGEENIARVLDGYTLHLPKVLDLRDDKSIIEAGDSFRHGSFKKRKISSKSLYDRIYNESKKNDRGLWLSQIEFNNYLSRGDILIPNESWKAFYEDSVGNKQVISCSSDLFNNIIDLGVFVKNRDSIYEMLRRN
ncbi:MAG: hypothetical protein WDZ69_00725 [Candidatus Pacearchaeota archaeon]